MISFARLLNQIGRDAVYNFINSMIKKSKYCNDHCHITGKYRGSAHRDCNNNLRLNHKIPIIFHNLKNYDSHLIIQELGKFNIKVNVIPNGFEKYMRFTINSKLIL